MGRPTLTNHLKFYRLSRALDTVLSPGFGDVVARGTLELLWDCAYESGDEYVGTAEDVEAFARWHGPRGVLAAALYEAGGAGSPGFIEQAPDREEGHFVIHDLWDHAPDYVRKRRERELARERKGKKLKHFVGKRAAPNGEHCPPNGSQRPVNDSRAAPNGRTRTPTPAPTPAPILTTDRPPDEDGGKPESPMGISLIPPNGDSESPLLSAPLTVELPTSAFPPAPSPAPKEEAAEPDAPSGDTDAASDTDPPDAGRNGRWPGCYALMSRFAQRMIIPEGQGLVRIARPDLIAEKREQIEAEVARLGVDLAADVCFQKATSERRRRGTYWLSYFLPLLQETPAPGDVHNAELQNGRTGCEPWDLLLEEARLNGGRSAIDNWLSRLEPRIEGGDLVLTAPDRYVAEFIADVHLYVIREAAQRKFGLQVRLTVAGEGEGTEATP